MRYLVRSTSFFFAGSYRLAQGRVYLVTPELSDAQDLLLSLSTHCFIEKQNLINGAWKNCNYFGQQFQLDLSSGPLYK